MKNTVSPASKSQTVAYRFVYGLYVILAVYLFLKGDVEWAVVNAGIALVFDPFDPAVRWDNRPVYQRVWLIIHVALVLAGFLFLLLK